MKKTRIIALLLAVVMVIGLTACGAKGNDDNKGTEPASDGSYKLGVTTWGSGVPILDMFGNENEYVMGLVGCTTVRVSDDFTADKQVTNIQNLISSGVQGICNQASAVTTVPQMAQLAADAKIPIAFNVSCGLESDLEALQNNNKYYCGAVDADMYLDGQIMAQKAYDDGCRTATMIGGNVGDADIDKRMNGFTDKFEELGGKVLANARCTDNSECPTKAEDMLSANKDADCIYATVGDYVAGSMSAIDNLGLSTKIYVSCTDEDSARYILEGRIAAGNDGIGLACSIAPALVINFLDGHQILNDEGKAPRLQTIPFTITKDNAQQYLDIFYGENSHPFTETMFKNLLWRNNPNVTYKDYVDLINNLTLEYLLEQHK
ncbi:MAG: sugar ABC transporter substrate-binding protein [Oscillospiraceae bacterium]|nr:sugar ABC transporter substrate-binding protein [Oscillospiraceae bacterium]